MGMFNGKSSADKYAAKVERETEKATDLLYCQQYGPGAMRSTQEIRKKLRGGMQTTLSFFGLKANSIEFAQLNALELNTEATLLLIDKLDAYMSPIPMPAIGSEWRHANGWTMTVISHSGTAIVVNSKHDNGYECRDILQSEVFYAELKEVK